MNGSSPKLPYVPFLCGSLAYVTIAQGVYHAIPGAHADSSHVCRINQARLSSVSFLPLMAAENKFEKGQPRYRWQEAFLMATPLPMTAFFISLVGLPFSVLLPTGIL